MSNVAQENRPVYSDLGGDPDLGELVEMFVDEMEDRIQSLRGAFDAGDLDKLRTLAHQLKGAAGSYGFGTITDAAFAVESSVRRQLSTPQIEHELESLLSLCRRARAGVPS